MPRYIDADKMVSKDNAYTTFPHDLAGCDDNDLVRWINEQPTADVVPKSDVASEILAEIENILDPMIQLNYAISVQHADPIERAKAISAEQALRAFRDYVAELKKKYTESEKEK